MTWEQIQFQSTPPVGAATRLDVFPINPNSLFQSTPPVGAATVCGKRVFEPPPYFNPRRPWGRRRGGAVPSVDADDISIHAARGGGDVYVLSSNAISRISIHAARGGGDRHSADGIRRGEHISIHAARGGGDGHTRRTSREASGHFNPRRPWGRRRLIPITPMRRIEVFQSTPPVGAATC